MQVHGLGGAWHKAQIAHHRQKTARLLIIALAIGLAGVATAFLTSVIDGRARDGVGSASAILVVAAVIAVMAAFGVHRRGAMFRRGLEGEQTVTKALARLDDRFHLFNNLSLSEEAGDLDHVLVGPVGVIAIETKDYSGEIECEDDDWYRFYPGRFALSWRGRPYWRSSTSYPISSPASQATRNAVNLKHFLAKRLGHGPWVHAIVVFSHPAVRLRLANPRVPIATPEELIDVIGALNGRSSIQPHVVHNVVRVLDACLHEARR